MSDDTKLYISLESHAGHLVIDGPMSLWRELVGSLTTGGSDPPQLDRCEPAGVPAETGSR
jgi:hypothetical protein